MITPIGIGGFRQGTGASLEGAFALTFLRPPQTSPAFFRRWAGSAQNWRPLPIGQEGPPPPPPSSGPPSRTMMGVGR